MIDTNQIRLGQRVISIAGRDKGRHMIVVEVVDALHVAVADGDLRRVAKPKVKKIKHLNVSKQIFEAVEAAIDNGEKLTDEKLRKLLEIYSKDRISDGGSD